MSKDSPLRVRPASTALLIVFHSQAGTRLLRVAETDPGPNDVTVYNAIGKVDFNLNQNTPELDLLPRQQHGDGRRFSEVSIENCRVVVLPHLCQCGIGKRLQGNSRLVPMIGVGFSNEPMLTSVPNCSTQSA